MISVLSPVCFKVAPSSGVVRVTDHNFAHFSKIHDKANPDMYWTSERIAKDLQLWSIFMSGDNYIMMSGWGEMADCYVLEASDLSVSTALLSSAVSVSFDRGATGIVFTIDKDNQLNIDAAVHTRFICIGECSAYRKAI